MMQQRRYFMILTKKGIYQRGNLCRWATQIDIHNPATEKPGEVEITESYFVNNDPTRWRYL